MDATFFHVKQEVLQALTDKWKGAEKPDSQRLEGYIFELQKDSDRLLVHPFYKHAVDDERDKLFVTQLEIEQCPTPPGYDDMITEWDPADFNS